MIKSFGGNLEDHFPIKGPFFSWKLRIHVWKTSGKSICLVTNVKRRLQALYYFEDNLHQFMLLWKKTLIQCKIIGIFWRHILERKVFTSETYVVLMCFLFQTSLPTGQARSYMTIVTHQIWRRQNLVSSRGHR